LTVPLWPGGLYRSNSAKFRIEARGVIFWISFLAPQLARRGFMGRFCPGNRFRPVKHAIVRQLMETTALPE
jgi:hypothetical protein